MPIRMEDDPDQPQSSGDEGGRSGGGSGFPGGGGGGGGLIQLILMLLGIFRGKGLILLLVIVVGGYFLFGKSCNTGSISQIAQQLSTGGFLDPKQFEKANIYEPLAEDNSKNPLPESANLQKYASAVGDQGHQGSCVAWSSVYGARTILEAARTGKDPNSTRFSPSFVYNQIGLEGCEGSYINRAMEFMTKNGVVAYDRFPYSDQDCSKQPDRALLEEARENRMRGFTRLSDGDRNDAIDLRAIKENLAQGAPVVIGMMVGGSYMQDMMGKDMWEPSGDDRNMMGFGGHAQCVVGYDDNKYGGSFLIMNSWGPQWGNNGFAWVHYSDFKYFVREAYGLEPMPRTGAAANAPFECEVGLVQVNFNNNKTVNGDYLPLKSAGENVFETVSPVKPGTSFKIEVKNSAECFVYVFGKETDGSSYTLFPYPSKEDPAKSKFSPFCGIAGYRLFPKGKHLKADSIGTKDYMAVVISRDSLNWVSLNNTLTQNPQQDYLTRLRSAIGTKLVRNLRAQTTGKGNMQFSMEGDNNSVVACVVEIDKQQ